MPSFVDFEWDDNKRIANAEKHGIDFADAVQIFEDPRQVTFRAAHHGEERFLSIGAIRGRIVTVVFTLRGEKVRIISVRSARKSERAHYER
jgi:uncharacterized DUF497 family protein